MIASSIRLSSISSKKKKISTIYNDRQKSKHPIILNYIDLSLKLPIMTLQVQDNTFLTQPGKKLNP